MLIFENGDGRRFRICCRCGLLVEHGGRYLGGMDPICENTVRKSSPMRWTSRCRSRASSSGLRGFRGSTSKPKMSNMPAIPSRNPGQRVHRRSTRIDSLMWLSGGGFHRVLRLTLQRPDPFVAAKYPSAMSTSADFASRMYGREHRGIQRFRGDPQRLAIGAPAAGAAGSESPCYLHRRPAHPPG